MLKGVSFIIFLLLSISAFPSNEQFLFRRISITEGLSNSWVRCAYQDDYGYMWFGTDDGLNRFDGATMKVYRPLSGNKLPMGNMAINCMLRANNDDIWLCTEIGLYRFIKKDESILADTLLPSHPVLSAVRDADGNVWFGTNRGLYCYSVEKKQTKLYSFNPNNPSSISDDYINALFVDSKGVLWVGTKNGLNRYNKQTDSFSWFRHSAHNGALSGNDVTTIFEDSNGRIWVGTALDGLNVMGNENGETCFEKVMPGSVTSLIQDAMQRLWVGLSSGGGIAILDLKKFDHGEKSYIFLKNDPLDAHSLGDNSVFGFFKDRHDDFWVLTFGGGVNFYSPRTKPFFVVSERFASKQSISNNLVNAFFEDDHYLWVGTQGGLNRLDKKTGEFKFYTYDPNNNRSLLSNSVYAITKDSRGNLWVGTWSGGLHRYNSQTDDFTRFQPDGKPGSIGSGNVFSICEDKKGNLWVGTVGGGLNRYDYNTGNFIKYNHDNNDPASLCGRSMSHVYQTSEGDLYISMYNTLEKYNYESDNFDHIVSLEAQSEAKGYLGNIQGVFQDSRGNIWITSTAGLRLYDPQTKTHHTYSTNDGLPDNTIQGILEDNTGCLWISTNKGISRFINGIYIPEHPDFQNFSYFDGLPTNDFKRNAAYKNSQGIMYFGSSRGYVYFNPDSILLNDQVPEIVFTRFMLLETSPNANSKFREIAQSINETNHLELHYPNTDFTISYAALNYLNPEKNLYKYKLEGYDTEWIEAGNNTSATYTNLVEGKYTFMVMGANNDGIWNPIPRQISIKIYPPWWRTAYFKIFTIVFVLLVLSVIVVSRMFMLNRENRLLEAIIDKRTNELSKLNSLLETKQTVILEQNEELSKHRNNLELLVEERTKQLAEARMRAEESDRLKSAFLANMSHEIRTPMNAIVGFSNLLVTEGLTTDKREKYSELIKNNSKLLFVLINDIIDISIIEANQLVLAKTRFNVNSILVEIFNYFDFENNNRLQFRYANMDATEDLFLYNDAIRFRQVMVNLLSNAFKYTDEGKVEMGYRIEEDKVRFYVTDTGCGIGVNEQEKIFDLFYKSVRDKMKLYRGTGIGLAICKRLVEQMEGSIAVESTVGKGSVFSFVLPLKSRDEQS